MLRSVYPRAADLWTDLKTLTWRILINSGVTIYRKDCHTWCPNITPRPVSLRTGFIPRAGQVAAEILVSLCRSKIFLNTVYRRVVFSTTKSEGVFQEEGRSFFSGGRYDQQQDLPIWYTGIVSVSVVRMIYARRA